MEHSGITPTPVLAITGSTGRLGGRIARLLAAQGVSQRLLTRSPDRAPALPSASVARAPYGDHAAVRAALSGIDTVLMVSAAEAPDRVEDHRTFISAAAAAGVEHVVYISFLGAAPGATFTLARDHWETEQAIREAGLGFTFLRDSLYADFLPRMVGPDDVLRGPAASGRVAAVAQDDIARAATAVLLTPAAHRGRSYDLTGPEALSLDQVARILTTASGRPITYRDETIEEAYASRASYGAPWWQVDAWVSTYTAIAAGELETVSSAVLDLTGRPATSLADLLAATSPERE